MSLGIKNKKGLTRFLSIPTLISLSIAILFILFLATQFDLDWTKTWDNIRGLNPLHYGLGLILYYSSFVVRGFRWRMLVKTVGNRSDQSFSLPSIPRFSLLILLGWFVNSIAWLRMGDAYRAYTLTQESHMDMPSSLGTILAERVTDMVAILALILVGVAGYSSSSESSVVWKVFAAAIFMGAALGVVLFVMRKFGTGIARKFPASIESRYREFHDVTMRSLAQLPAATLLGLVGWLLETARLVLVVYSLDLSITWPLALVVSIGHAILSTVPTPGGVGAVEPGVTGLLVLGMDRSDALSVALTDRTITYLSILVFGGIAMLFWQASYKRRNM